MLETYVRSSEGTLGRLVCRGSSGDLGKKLLGQLDQLVVVNTCNARSKNRTVINMRIITSCSSKNDAVRRVLSLDKLAEII